MLTFSSRTSTWCCRLSSCISSGVHFAFSGALLYPLCFSHLSCSPSELFRFAVPAVSLDLVALDSAGRVRPPGSVLAASVLVLRPSSLVFQAVLRASRLLRGQSSCALNGPFSLLDESSTSAVSRCFHCTSATCSSLLASFSLRFICSIPASSFLTAFLPSIGASPSCFATLLPVEVLPTRPLLVARPEVFLSYRSIGVALGTPAALSNTPFAVLPGRHVDLFPWTLAAPPSDAHSPVPTPEWRALSASSFWWAYSRDGSVSFFFIHWWKAVQSSRLFASLMR